MTNWHGHTSTTSAAVLAVLNKSRAAGTRFSHTERVLHTACEFWVAAVSHSLTRYLGTLPRIVLRDAEAAFAAIEIPSVADILRAARTSPAANTPTTPAGQVALEVQQALDDLEAPVDELIGKFAAEQTWSRLKQPTFANMESLTAAPPEARIR